MKNFNSEKDLAKVVVSWLQEQHWDVWQEVQFHAYGPTNDIYAMNGKISWAIECKLTLNLKVIEQAFNSRAIIKSIAIPYRNYNSFGEKVCKDYGIGVISVSNSGNINYFPGKLNREFYKFSEKTIEFLNKVPKEFCEAGSKSGHWTPYKATIEQCKLFIKKNPGCSISDIMKDIKHHYRSDSTAKACIAKALREWETSWCKIEDKKFFLK